MGRSDNVEKAADDEVKKKIMMVMYKTIIMMIMIKQIAVKSCWIGMGFKTKRRKTGDGAYLDLSSSPPQSPPPSS